MKTLQQLDTIYTPYCYLIGWKKHNKFYYGVRFAKKYKCLYESGCHPDDFWVTYNTSSDYVKVFREKYGEPDIRQVRRTFTTAKEAQDWEQCVLKRLNAINNSMWLNKGSGGSVFCQCDEVRKKMSDSQTGKVLSQSTKDKISKACKGKVLSQSTKDKISNARKGRLHSQSTKDRIARKNRRVIKIYSTLQDRWYIFKSREEMVSKIGDVTLPEIEKGWRIERRTSRTRHPFEIGDYVTLDIS